MNLRAVTALEDRKMSKLSFRARTVDANKRMPVCLSEDLPDLSDYVSINRTIPQMPTGMEKDEEKEYHLQQVISAQQRQSGGNAEEADALVIPVPKVSEDVVCYDLLYPPNYKLSKQLIKVHASLNLEPEEPMYDLDSDDERWLQSDQHATRICPLLFERIIDSLEKHSEYQVIRPNEVKLLIQEDEDILFGVYDYWLAKRHKATTQGTHLIPRVKLEKRDAPAHINNNPYVAFRKRAEKMQTRKNRRNDEESYEKILRLRYDLQKATMLAEMVERREKGKRESVNLSMEIVEKHFNQNDFAGDIMSKIRTDANSFKNETSLLSPQSPSKKRKKLPHAKDDVVVSMDWLQRITEQWQSVVNEPPAWTKPPDVASQPLEKICPRETDRSPNPYAFKRRRQCKYYAPAKESDDIQAQQEIGCSEYFPTHLHSRHASSNQSNTGLRFVGVMRRRFGRGGRLLFDRLGSSPNEYSNTSASTSVESTSIQIRSRISGESKTTYYRPVSPIDDDLLGNELNLLDQRDEPSVIIVGLHGKLTLPITVGTITTAEGEERISDNFNPDSTMDSSADEIRVNIPSVGHGSAVTGSTINSLCGSENAATGTTQQHQQSIPQTSITCNRPTDIAGNLWKLHDPPPRSPILWPRGPLICSQYGRLDLGYPLPTPSPSPSASDSGLIDVKLEEYQTKTSTFMANMLLGQLAPFSLGEGKKNRVD